MDDYQDHISTNSRPDLGFDGIDAPFESPPLRNGPESGQITLFHWGD